MAVLRALKGLNPGQIFPLDKDVAILGRHPDCDIVLDAGAVSREHARILHIEGEYYVEDLHSRNGTFLNEQPVVGRQKLSENDQLRICDLVFVFHAGVPLDGGAPRPTDWTALMEDDASAGSSSTITSKVDVSSGRSGLRIAVNPEAKLRAVLEIGQNLGRAISLRDVLPKLLDNLFSIFLQADRGFIMLKDSKTGKLVPAAVKHRREGRAEQIRVSRTILNGVMASKEAILSADAATDSRFDMSESIVDFHIHSMMCAPLVATDGDVLGVIQIDTHDQRHRFSPEDLELLASVACQAAVAVENAQLHEVAVQEEGLRRELTVAHEVQRGFLPASRPELPNYEFFDYYEPANQLGGDYYDYVQLPGGRLAVVLADVSGKGISAALLMAKLSAETRFSLVREPSPAEAVARLNQVFCDSRWEDRFVTLVLAVLDPQSHEVAIVNAGHMAPLLRRSTATVEPIGESIGGLPLGVEAGAVYQYQTIRLAPGDTLTMYTDGIPDAMNLKQEFYGTERLLAQLADREANRVALLGQRVLENVKQFIGNRPQSDDMCLTCFGRL